MALTCGNCGQNAVEEDGQYSQAHLICTSCGAVAEEGGLSSNSIAFKDVINFKDRGLSLRSKGRMGCGSSHPSSSRGHKQGMETISTLSSRLGVPFSCIQDAKDLYKTALQQPLIKGAPINKKVFVAAGCLYVVLRRAQWPISIVAVCHRLKCFIEDFSSGYRLLVRALNLQLKQPAIEDMVEGVLGDLSLGEERASVSKQTTDLIQVARQLWLATGRSNVPLIHACAFFAWKSARPERCSATFARFCTDMGIKRSKTAYARVGEVCTMLVELGKKIPWLDPEEIINRNICHYLQDVLTFSSSLRVDAHVGEPDTEQMAGEEFAKFRKMKKNLPRDDDGIPEVEVHGDADIADEEIEQYLRSDREVEVLRQLYQKYDKTVT